MTEQNTEKEAKRGWDYAQDNLIDGLDGDTMCF